VSGFTEIPTLNTEIMHRAKQALTERRTARATTGKRNASAAYCWRKWRLTLTVAGFDWTTAQSSIQTQHCSSEQPYKSIRTDASQSTSEMTSCYSLDKLHSCTVLSGATDSQNVSK